MSIQSSFNQMLYSVSAGASYANRERMRKEEASKTEEYRQQRLERTDKNLEIEMAKQERLSRALDLKEGTVKAEQSKTRAEARKIRAQAKDIELKNKKKALMMQQAQVNSKAESKTVISERANILKGGIDNGRTENN